LCAALYWGQNWARWALLAPVGFRVWRLSLLTATAWGLGRPGIALFLTLIILVELAAAFILLDRYLRYSPFPPPSHKNATTMSSCARRAEGARSEGPAFRYHWWMASPVHATEPALQRVIGVRGLAAAIFNITVGAAVFVLPAHMAASLGAAAPLAY